LKKLIFLALPLAFAACDITQPVAVIGPKGEIYKGSVTASMSNGGSFVASNGKVSCSGTYDAMTVSPTVSFPVVCSDGRKGLGTATRDSGGTTGSGTIKMNDGSDWTFVFGPAANAF
jgi:hypothetical protein